MGRRSAEARRSRQTSTPDPLEREFEADEAKFLRRHIARQEGIALGKGKPKPTPAQETAAGKEARDARIRLLALTHASDSARFDLSQLTDRLDVLEWCVDADEAQLEWLREVLRERAEGER